MFKSSESSEELAELMRRSYLVKEAEDATHANSITEAYESLVKAADLFDDLGMEKAAEFLTKFIESTEMI